MNYLAPFLLTTLLLDRLIESRATVISTSSPGNRLGRIDLANLDGDKRYRGVNAYNNAKLAQILFTRELDRRYRSQGLASAAFSPGLAIVTNFAQQPGDANNWIARSPVFRRLLGSSPETGSNTLVYLAQGTPGTDFPSGEYFVKRKGRPREQAGLRHRPRGATVGQIRVHDNGIVNSAGTAISTSARSALPAGGESPRRRAHRPWRQSRCN